MLVLVILFTYYVYGNTYIPEADNIGEIFYFNFQLMGGTAIFF